jgi:hypothetical protein
MGIIAGNSATVVQINKNYNESTPKQMKQERWKLNGTEISSEHTKTEYPRMD